MLFAYDLWSNDFSRSITYTKCVPVEELPPSVEELPSIHSNAKAPSVSALGDSFLTMFCQPTPSSGTHALFPVVPEFGPKVALLSCRLSPFSFLPRCHLSIGNGD